MKHKKTIIIVVSILAILGILYALQYFGFLWTEGATCNTNTKSGEPKNTGGTWQNGKCKPMMIYVLGGNIHYSSNYPNGSSSRTSSNSWNYESVKPISLNSWILQGYANDHVGGKISAGKYILFNVPTKSQYKVDIVNVGGLKDTVQISSNSINQANPPPPKGSIQMAGNPIIVPIQPPTQNSPSTNPAQWNFSNVKIWSSVPTLKFNFSGGKLPQDIDKNTGVFVNLGNGKQFQGFIDPNYVNLGGYEMILNMDNSFWNEMKKYPLDNYNHYKATGTLTFSFLS